MPAVALGAGLLGLTPLSVPVIAACAVPMARRAARSVGRRSVSIDVLDTAAVTILLGSGDLLAAGLSVGLVELGERIRRRAAGQARRVLGGVMTGHDRGVRLVREGSEPRVSLDEVQLGDRVVVYTGEMVPVDGVIVGGAGSLDTQAWTGEPNPRRVAVDDAVLAGSTVSDGRLVISVTAAGDATRAGRLGAALEDAVASSTRVSDLAQRLAGRFVLPVLVTAAGVYALTGDVGRLASMLIVDFGTGLRISVPTAILSTMIAGARRDVLFRTGQAVERLADVDTFVFDKTGTLTSGAPRVLSVDLADGAGVDVPEILRLAAAAEGHLPHPVARAIRAAARRRQVRPPEPTAVRYVPGGGVIARVDGHDVIVGDRRMLDDNSIPLPRTDAANSTRIYVAVDGHFAATVRLHDALRPEAPAVIAAIRAMGCQEIWLATGDRPEAARSVGRRLELDNVRSRMMPEDKLELVRELQARGRRVALVGDGINDAAAMAEADVGIAVTRGAELARQTADVVLGGDDLMVLVEAIERARFAMRVVRQNVGLVAVLNGAALVAATAGALSPLLATTVNNGSTVAAAGNSIRLLRGGSSPSRRRPPAAGPR